MATKIRIRRGTAATWTAANPILLSGELGLETDTGRVKGGNGSSAWNSLSYVDDRTSTRTPTDNSVTSAKIVDGAIVNADINASAAIAESKLSLASDAAAGTASRRTLGTGALQAAAGNDSRFTDTRTPTDNSVTSAKIVDGAIVNADVNASAAIAESKLSLASDAAAATASRRTLGTGATQAAAGDHNHDTRYDDDVFIPATSMVASFGAPSLGFAPTSNWPVFLFDGALGEHTAASVRIPAHWATMDVFIVWANAGAGTGAASWAVGMDRATTGESIDAAFGGGLGFVATAAGTAWTVVESQAFAAVAVTPARTHNIRVIRLNDGPDTLSNDAGVIGVRLVRVS